MVALTLNNRDFETYAYVRKSCWGGLIREVKGWSKINLYIQDVFCSLRDLFLRLRFYIQPEYKFKTQLTPVMLKETSNEFILIHDKVLNSTTDMLTKTDDLITKLDERLTKIEEDSHQDFYKKSRADQRCVNTHRRRLKLTEGSEINS